MVANNWDIEIIKEETQAALYIRGTHQMALSIVFLISSDMHRFTQYVVFKYTCQKTSEQIDIVSIPMVTYSTKGKQEQHCKRAKS